MFAGVVSGFETLTARIVALTSNVSGETVTVPFTVVMPSAVGFTDDCCQATVYSSASVASGLSPRTFAGSVSV